MSSVTYISVNEDNFGENSLDGFELNQRVTECWRLVGGAKKLYISAHSARETIAAYQSYGCTQAEEINRELAEKEPCDLQLEYKLY